MSNNSVMFEWNGFPFEAGLFIRQLKVTRKRGGIVCIGPYTVEDLGTDGSGQNVAEKIQAAINAAGFGEDNVDKIRDYDFDKEHGNEMKV